MPALMIDGHTRNYDKGTTYEKIAAEFQETSDSEIALCMMNGKLRELIKKVDTDGVLRFITTRDEPGHKAYERTAEMMLVKAVAELCGKQAHVKVEFALGNGIYCSVSGTDETVDEAFAQRVQQKMEQYRDRKIPISKRNCPKDDALALFARQGMSDKVDLFRFRRISSINIYNMDGYYDYFYGYMLPNTGYVRLFSVEAYEGGLVLVLPDRENPEELEPFVPQPDLFDTLMLTSEWGECVNISTVGELNLQICGGHISEMILVQEALQERRIGEIASEIYDREDVRIVFIAGPSSSGKTTFAHRLAIQLRTFGMYSHIISMDDYFVNREKTPVDIDGNYDYDCPEALDAELFTDDMNDLLEGNEVEIPSYNFKTGKREYKGRKMLLGDDDILIIEGIHGLNPRMSEGLPEESVYRIFTSALTSLNIDEHNRIPSTDARLLRRLVRDARLRGNDCKATLQAWNNVRAREEQYIFPYQKDADTTFNSVLIYELSVLKQFAEPLLFSIDPGEPEYIEAKRLLKFLDYFVGVDTAAVPTNSICREFVGGGCFSV